MRAFVDAHRGTYGVEPICKVLQIAPSGDRRYAARRRDPAQSPARARRDAVLMPRIEQVWRQLKREGMPTARCTVGVPHAPAGAAGRGAWQGRAHHDAGHLGIVSAGSGASGL